MLDDQQAYEQLRGLVAQQERAAATLEAEVVDLERELNDFRARYYAAVGYAEKRLEAAQALLLDLQRVDAYTPTGGRLPPNFIPVDEQYRQKWARLPDDDPYIAVKPIADALADPADLKRIYRTLARKYHPDFGVDAADRDRRTDLMARINEAYAHGDLRTLRMLESDDPHDPYTPPNAQKSLATLRLAQLRQTHERLTADLAFLKLRQSDLLNSPWMQLKLDETLLKLKGRDLFREVLANLSTEFAQVQAHIDRLRNGGVEA